jgi:tetratricopeptide (TPR) repeat protein
MKRSALASVLAAVLAAAAVPAQTIEWWQKDLDGALAACKDKPAGATLLYCWRDNHGACADMFSGTLSDKKVAEALAGHVCMAAKDDAAGKPVLAKYGIESVPTVLFLDPAGAVVDVVTGYIPVAEFLGELKRIGEGKETIGALRKQCDGAPADLALQMRLVRKLRSAGDKKGSAAVIAAIVAKDPKFVAEAAAEAKMLEICDQTFRPDVPPQDVDLKPLRTFLGAQKHKRVQFLGYDRLAGAEYRRQNLKAAADAAGKAWKSVPPDQVIAYGQNLAGKAYENWQALEKIDKGLLKDALDVSKKALDEVEKRHKTSPDGPYLASALYLHAAVQMVNNQRKEAFAAMDRAMALNPNDENLKKAKDRWLDGSK